MVTARGRNSGSITEAMNSTVISGTPRTNSMKPTDTQRTIGMLRAPAQRQQDADWERRGDADAGDDQRHQQAAPQLGRHEGQPEHAADQQDERQHREDGEHVDRRPQLAGMRGTISGTSPASAST